MRAMWILILAFAFLSGCSTTPDYRGVNTKPTQQIFNPKQ